MIGSPYYWALVAAITLVFAAIDIDALSHRRMGRVHGLSAAGYVAAWGIAGGLALPAAPLGALWWLFPAAVRIAVAAALGGGRLIAGARENAAPEDQMRADELREAEAYDAQWQAAERARLREEQIERALHPQQAAERSDAAFERFVRHAIAELPADIRAQMSNVAIVVEDEPPPGQPLLGLYRGVPLTRRGTGYAGVLPDKITIYRGPLERRYGADLGRLSREVRRTVWHEVAHHFGITDQRLLEIDRY